METLQYIAFAPRLPRSAPKVVTRAQLIKVDVVPSPHIACGIASAENQAPTAPSAASRPFRPKILWTLTFNCPTQTHLAWWVAWVTSVISSRKSRGKEDELLIHLCLRKLFFHFFPHCGYSLLGAWAPGETIQPLQALTYLTRKQENKRKEKFTVMDLLSSYYDYYY